MIAVLVAATVAFILSLAGTPAIRTYFVEHGLGQKIREDGPGHHQVKAGTPTMGGVALISAALIGWLAARLVGVDTTPVGLVVVAIFVASGIVGFADDWIKLRMDRNLGLSKTAKFGGQGLVALAVATLGPPFAGIESEISAVGDVRIAIPVALFVIWVFVLLAGTTNAVNLTDGLDGLAAGTSVLALGAFVIITFWQFRHPGDYTIDPAAARDLSVLAASAMAASLGFLWHNAPPAAIFMGDTGSLALGGLLAGLALATGTQLLLVLIGGLFVIETLSVIMQVVSFRLFAGRRIFRMAPLHHHFELLGWQETTVIVRFWIIAGLGVALGMGLFYAEYLARVGTT